ncbi:Tvp38p [Malassezia vespertilionis]|uniref:Golgi apparatus membrane protein TVP38 n=1 Tax=Malassezia vespertilionis TaxID=2020962 RepID=A0A2N1JCQ8_9BASI|nr:Tvp38p [Malassezia vespertilionis]
MVTIAGMAFASAVSSEKNMRVTWWYSVGRFFYGWIIASVGLVISSYISFVFLQYILARMHGHWRVLDTIKGDRRFRALQEAVHERGLWMAVLSRFCPMPYCYTNLLLASLDALPVSVYILSSVLASPRLMLHVFMGAKMFELMDRDVRAHQDMGTRIMNGAAAG